ncbi:type I restriction endonuclease [Roseivirga sp. UBA1976]|uniref:type I restriction endonuclease subunit R n=1 Tax=Roseivirga sp. UBA1976 TaxID=1947386 RepID=UPI00257B93B1|nr:type I restriction endonuclease [Roseivirga sp. UBA1976]MEC7753229.1 type I restriction endonuclease [Bacteroidota bacterium]|tara:strand:- start:4371 stop:7433 length:3063 start_codon:yes stop_codon:yes gene_type:complete
MKFNEDTRVKIPAILHLMRLGYQYISLKDSLWDTETNIFRDIFNESITKINKGNAELDLNGLYNQISLELENEDLGQAFFERLTSRSGIKLIDFNNFENNSFHVVTELPYEKDEDVFRPDVIVLINGMPLSFIEVKKPNNLDGIQAEHKRMKTRFQNKKFRKFVNLTQFMVFSNNMEYDDENPTPIQGAFYASPSYHEPVFNYFREDPDFDFNISLQAVSPEEELRVLKDTNLYSIKDSGEFALNKAPDTPTNRILTSLYSKERLAFILEFAFAYVKESTGLQKHIMRYPQFFATKAIERTLEQGGKKGIIWHTQGSGKTALTFYNVKYLKHYFSTKGVIPKFYFIVDRIDLLIQAGREFKSRGLVVHTIDSKEEFVQDIKANMAVHNDSGKAEITVVNIQKFKDDPSVVSNKDYQLNVQRIYFLDEVHRSYNPEGSFLANLNQSDPDAIKIGLTGTPLLGDSYNSRSLFGNYIHKYYYNASIADGYTLRLIREEIETSYQMALQKALEDIKVLEGEGKRKIVYAHPRFVEPMLDYIVEDFQNSRLRFDDNSIGGMVICDSSDQAKELFRIFQDKYEAAEPQYLAADDPEAYGKKKMYERKVKTAALILHDIGNKEERKEQVEAFKEGKIDFLFVFNMLLTGFDAKRLKKLYICRVIKSHNLLQALTRVNRTYKDFRYGYVVDFADIQKEFDKTNREYFNELQSELGDEIEHYSNLFKSTEEIEADIEDIKDILLYFDTTNAEAFSRQINEINDRQEMLNITKALNTAKSLYNLIRLTGNYDLLEKLDFKMLNKLSTLANSRLSMINMKQHLDDNSETTNLLNVALEDIIFAFTKVKEEEMVLADQLKNTLQRTREMLGGNFDPKDPRFISLKDELERLFKKKNLSEVTKEEMEANIEALNKIYDKAKELERKNQLLRAKYANDAKYARVHKRLVEKDPLTDKEAKLIEVLQSIKSEVDQHIMQNANILSNESFAKKMMARIVVNQIKNKFNLPVNAAQSKRIYHMIAQEYLNEFNGRAA